MINVGHVDRSNDANCKYGTVHFHSTGTTQILAKVTYIKILKRT